LQRSNHSAQIEFYAYPTEVSGQNPPAGTVPVYELAPKNAQQKGDWRFQYVARYNPDAQINVNDWVVNKLAFYVSNEPVPQS